MHLTRSLALFAIVAVLVASASPLPDHGGAHNDKAYGGALADKRGRKKKDCDKKTQNSDSYAPPTYDGALTSGDAVPFMPPTYDQPPAYPQGDTSAGGDNYMPSSMPDYPDGGTSAGGDGRRRRRKKPCPKGSKGSRPYPGDTSNGQYDAPVPDYPSGGASNGQYDAPPPVTYGGGASAGGDNYMPPKKPCPTGGAKPWTGGRPPYDNGPMNNYGGNGYSGAMPSTGGRPPYDNGPMNNYNGNGYSGAPLPQSDDSYFRLIRRDNDAEDGESSDDDLE